ncbi:MAG TPA: DivIVA domain-containing protein [Nocardioides sp.]|nr:DivIVA domain-containing protein [Nocardioides sp.]
MPLTPEDVSNKRFTPVRLREGYDMGEVDQFLDEVEAELARLTQENDDLRAKLAAAQAGGSTGAGTSTGAGGSGVGSGTGASCVGTSNAAEEPPACAAASLARRSSFSWVRRASSASTSSRNWSTSPMS